MPSDPDKQQIKKRRQMTLIYVILVLLVITLANTLFGPKLEKVEYSEFLKMGESGEIKSLKFEGERIYLTLRSDENRSKLFPKLYYTVSIGDNEGLARKLETWQIDSYGAVIENQTNILSIIFSWVLPIALLVGVWYFIIKMIGKKMGNPMSFGKNSEKVYAEKSTGVTFDDVAGQEEAKAALVEIVDFLDDPTRFDAIGAKMPKGALLVGPPGTGKTLLARAVAGEAKVPFFSMSGSEFVQMFVGVGASRVRDLFTQAGEKAPCIIFIDEIDAIGKSRATQGVSNDEREQTLNQLLAEMDGFDANKGVVILAATNRPEVLDPALLRPGRFDRRIIVERPDLAGREAILKVHSHKVKMGEDVDLRDIARTTSGAVGADLANIINEAALLAVKRKHAAVMQDDLMEAIEISIAGQVKRDRILSNKEKLAVSYHETGHAMVAALLDNTDPVHKITIVPRTKGALGYTMQRPTEEKYLVTKDELLDQIAVMLGGRAAEEVALGQISTGAANDIERATASARRMISLYGMSETFDMMALESAQSTYLDGRPVSTCSPDTAAKIDKEALRIIKMQHQRAIDILTDNKAALDACTKYLLEHETISGEAFTKLLEEKRET